MANQLSPAVVSATRSEGEGCSRKVLNYFFIMQLQKKNTHLSSLLFFSMDAWSGQDTRESNQPWVQYWNTFFSSSNACNWGIFPECAAVVAAVLACSYLIWRRWIVCLPGSSYDWQTGIRTAYEKCRWVVARTGWCSMCCGVGCCQGGLGELPVCSQLCVWLKESWSGAVSMMVTGECLLSLSRFQESSFPCLCLVHVSRRRLSFSRYCGVVEK